ncbi:pantetheine-phosphate adenylyltransferase [Lacticigenium naphthae]|uniref:pantetheine-phosphate adenylyltransferase n=1 Tax=Lacticigenium naphthae TaxID=515351 RepID=UPI000425CBC6|nr:pantetheine-phosphate adenylyltransferase [Lacticigenium naphthae]
MAKALYAGSFDPFSKGHLDIAVRGTRLFEEVIIVVATNTSKKGLFSAKEKVGLIKEVVKDYSKISVLEHSGKLTADLANELDTTVLLRGVRTVKDYEYEYEIALMNKVQNENLETVILFADEKYRHISSSLIKEVAKLNGTVEPFLPSIINTAIKKKFE